MKIRLKYFGQLRALTVKDTEEIDVRAEETVTGLVASLSRKYGHAFEAITLMVLVNGRMVDKTAQIRLSEGQEISLLTPIAGG